MALRLPKFRYIEASMPKELVISIQDVLCNSEGAMDDGSDDDSGGPCVEEALDDQTLPNKRLVQHWWNQLTPAEQDLMTRVHYTFDGNMTEENLKQVEIAIMRENLELYSATPRVSRPF